MVSYVDIHSHILPGVDDGSRSIEESMEMLRMAYEEGVRTIFATPHYGMQQYTIDQHQCEELVDELNALIRISADLNGMKVILGNEILYHAGVSDEIKSGAVRTLGNTNFVLVEFYENTDYTVMLACAREMSMAGYRPIYAHVERYGCLRDSIAKIATLRSEGVLMQVNGATLLLDNPVDRENNAPKFNIKKLFTSNELSGWEAEIAARIEISDRLFNSDLVDFIASDAHRRDTREPVMARALEVIKERYGEEVSHNLMINAQILGE